MKHLIAKKGFFSHLESIVQSEPLRECVEYCRQANGLPRCKNCGLDDNMIDKALESAQSQILDKAIEIVEKDNTKIYNFESAKLSIINKLQALKQIKTNG